MDQAIADQVYDIIAKHADIDRAKLTPEATLKDLGIDSLEAIETIFDIEEHFDISFPSQDPNLDGGTLAGLVDAVEQALAAKASASPAT
ncbi:MAG: acyl carrier protein [Lysobacter sp.]|nr:acyl carrier protein [Lysobacter sp.]